MAFRMAQDLGLHRNPEDCSTEEGNIRTSLVDIESRRRMHSTCYISDKSPLAASLVFVLQLTQSSGS